MKKIIFTFLSIFALSFTSNAQTTVEEYNYIVKGYKVQIESGLDMKKGYVLEDLQSFTAGVRSATLKKLTHVEGSKKRIAAYMVVYQREGNAKEYICVPNPNSTKEVTDAYWKELWDGSNDSSARLQLISYLLSTQLKW